MRRIPLSFFLIAILITAPGRAWTAEDPQAIIAKAVKAMGGEAAIAQTKATQSKIKGVLHDGGEGTPYTGEIFAELPTRFKLAFQLEVGGTPLNVTEVLAGTNAWTRDPEFNPADAETLLDMQQSAYVDYVSSMVPLLKPGPKYVLSLLKETTVQDQAAVGVKIASEGKPDISLYFDKSSGLLIKVEHRRRDPRLKKDVFREEYFSDYREVNPTAADEETLRAAKLPTDTPALIEFLKKNTLDDATYIKIKALIKDLGDASFQVREKAKELLVAQGVVVVPLLSAAQKDADAEVASNAKECLQKIGKTPDLAIPIAGVRILAIRKPAGTAEVLLAYLPSAPDETVAKEVQAALKSVAFQEGKPAKALLDALKDNDPKRRAAAKAILGADERNVRAPAGQRLSLAGLKRAMKGIGYQDTKKIIEWELTDIQFFNKLDDGIFAKQD